MDDSMIEAERFYLGVWRQEGSGCRGESAARLFARSRLERGASPDLPGLPKRPGFYPLRRGVPPVPSATITLVKSMIEADLGLACRAARLDRVSGGGPDAAGALGRLPAAVTIKVLRVRGRRGEPDVVEAFLDEVPEGMWELDREGAEVPGRDLRFAAAHIMSFLTYYDLSGSPDGRRYESRVTARRPGGARATVLAPVGPATLPGL